MLKLRLSFSLRLCTTRRLSFSDSAPGMSMLNCNTPMCIMASQEKQGGGISSHGHGHGHAQEAESRPLWSADQVSNSVERALDEVDGEELELVALAHVVVVRDRQAALEVRFDLSDVVLDALEASYVARVDDL